MNAQSNIQRLAHCAGLLFYRLSKLGSSVDETPIVQGYAGKTHGPLGDLLRMIECHSELACACILQLNQRASTEKNRACSVIGHTPIVVQARAAPD
jgi:hypothetical protein